MGEPEKRQTPWWAYPIALALLTPNACVAAFCFWTAYVVFSAGPAGLGEVYALLAFGIAGAFWTWYCTAAGWRIIRNKW